MNIVRHNIISIISRMYRLLDSDKRHQYRVMLSIKFCFVVGSDTIIFTDELQGILEELNRKFPWHGGTSAPENPASQVTIHGDESYQHGQARREIVFPFELTPRDDLRRSQVPGFEEYAIQLTQALRVSDRLHACRVESEVIVSTSM
jgi:hypothetical protein